MLVQTRNHGFTKTSINFTNLINQTNFSDALQVESLQRRLQGMHLEYSQMLQQTLTKLHDEVLSPYVNEAARNIGGAIQHK